MTNQPTKPGHMTMLLRNIPKPIHKSLKALARKRGITMKAVILEALRKEFEKEKDNG